MKLLLSLFAFLFLGVAQAADTVRITDASSLTSITANTNTSFSLYAESPSGDATSESAPAKVYIPMDNIISGVDPSDYFYLNLGANTYNLFGYNSVTTTTYSGQTLTFPLTVATGTSKLYLYAAVKYDSSSKYFIIDSYGTQLPSSATNDVSFNVSPQDMCKYTVSTNCSSFDHGAGTPTEATSSVIVYFFLSSTSNLAIGTTQIDPASSDYNGGVYFSVNMSNYVYTTPTDITLNITNVRKGDKRILGTVTPTLTIPSNIYRRTMAFYKATSSAPACDQTPAGCAYTSSQEITTTQSTEFTFSGLTNSQQYYFSIGLVDKYGISTGLSSQQTETPTQIEELLKKQNCFLLTAGFGEEHFVIDYFRHFRDHTLVNYYFGRVFIKNYYKYAPSFALSIYNNDSIRFLIRTSAYGLYYLFNYFTWVMGFFVVSLGILFSLKKQKKFS